MDAIRVISNQEFIKQPGIDKLASIPFWSISANANQEDAGDKVPIHWQAYKDTHSFKFYNLNPTGDPNHPYAALTTLDEINADPNFEHTNRTFRLNAKRTNMIMLDIEPICNPKLMEQLITQLPFVYGEQSQHGGYHLLLDLAKFNDNQALIDTFNDVLSRTQIKGPINPDLPFDDPDNKPQFECILNDHFITFTRKMIKPPKLDQQTAKHNLLEFLSYLQSALIPKYDTDSADQPINMLNDQLTDGAKLVLKLFNQDQIDHIFSTLTLADCNNDDSLFEYRMAFKVEYHLFRFQKAPNLNDQMTWGQYLQLRDKVSDQDIVLATADILQHNLPPRKAHTNNNGTSHNINKWNTIHNGMPWLLYTAVNAYNNGSKKLALNQNDD